MTTLFSLLSTLEDEGGGYIHAMAALDNSFPEWRSPIALRRFKQESLSDQKSKVEEKQKQGSQNLQLHAHVSRGVESVMEDHRKLEDITLPSIRASLEKVASALEHPSRRDWMLDSMDLRRLQEKCGSVETLIASVNADDFIRVRALLRRAQGILAGEIEVIHRAAVTPAPASAEAATPTASTAETASPQAHADELIEPDTIWWRNHICDSLSPQEFSICQFFWARDSAAVDEIMCRKPDVPFPRKYSHDERGIIRTAFSNLSNKLDTAGIRLSFHIKKGIVYKRERLAPG
jgi:hypothetical protein